MCSVCRTYWLFFPTHHTAQILLPYISTSLDASKIHSVGKYLGAMTRQLKKWLCGCEYKIQTLNEGVDALVSWRRKAVEDYADYVEKNRFATDTSSYHTSTSKKLYNKLLAIKIVLQRFLCEIHIKGINCDLKSFIIQYAFLPCILHAAPPIPLNLMKRIIFGTVHITDHLTKQLSESYCNFIAPIIFLSTSYCFLPYIRCIMFL